MLKRIAKGLTPREGMEWPLSDVVPQVSASAMEDLWPDMRSSGRCKRRRNAPFNGDVVGEQLDGAHEGVLNEDGDPWGDGDQHYLLCAEIWT